MEKNIKLSALNRNEALRYMGVRGRNGASDESVIGLLDECEKLVMKAAVPRYIYKVFKFDDVDSGVKLDGTNLILEGNSVRELLDRCDMAVCIAVTLSDGIDRQLRLLQVSDMAKAVVFDSLASVAVEQVCDRVEELLKEEYPEYYQTYRFGIGYGDLPISSQRAFLKVIDAPRKIGLNVNTSCMLTPTKSVTAVIGLSGEQLEKKSRGCATCNLNKTCAYRGMGGHCSG